MCERRAARVSECDTCRTVTDVQLVTVEAPYEPKVEGDVWPRRYEEHFLCEKCLRLLTIHDIAWRHGGLNEEQAAKTREWWRTESRRAKNPPSED